MINTKRPNTSDYIQVGFIEAKDTQGNYQNIDHIYDSQGNIVFQQGYLNEYQGADNFSIPAIGKPLIDYTIYGNMYQASGVSPDNPIMPQGTGERTGQIIEYPYSNESGTIDGVQWTISENGHIKGVGTTSSGTNFYLNRNCFLKAGTYTLKIYGKYEGMALRLYDSVNKTIIATISQSNTDSFKTFTLDSDTSNECRIYFNVGSAGTNVDIDCDVMFNSGSTALPYEPYGYKIPISSAGQTNNTYLGEVLTTRHIKKLVFDGTETGWRQSSTFFFNQELNPDYLRAKNIITCICSHYQAYQQVGIGANVPEGYCSLYYSQEVQRFYIKDSNFATTADFKTYLQQQYAAGTPVTIWYVLAEPETAVVNEPLRKIGDYADTVSYEQAGVQIPTNRGNTVIDVLTELKPSEVDVTYRGSTKPKYNLFLAQNGDSFEAKDGQSLYIGGGL